MVKSLVHHMRKVMVDIAILWLASWSLFHFYAVAGDHYFYNWMYIVCFTNLIYSANKVWMLTMTPSSICFGCRRCGVCPFDSNSIDSSLTSSSSTGGECGKNSNDHNSHNW